METYQKINGLYKRYKDGPNRGKFIMGDWAVPEFEYLADNDWEFTEKVDGTNIRIHLRRYDDNLYVDFGGRTDNAVIPKHLLVWLESMFVPTTTHRNISERERLVGLWMLDNDLTDVILFGEGYGPKIQNGGNYRDDVSFVLFDVKIGEFWLDRANVDDVAEKLGIDSVPVIGHGTLYDAIRIVAGRERKPVWQDPRNQGYEPDYYEDVPTGAFLKSQWGDFEAEGIVARTSVPLFDRKGQRIITKIKAVDFRE